MVNGKKILKKMKIAIIDLGTNTFHILIAEIQDDAIKRAVKTLEYYKKIALNNKVEEFYLIGTSIILMRNLMELCDFQHIRVANYSLKEGVLFSIIDRGYA